MKYLRIALVAAMTVGLAGCGGDIAKSWDNFTSTVSTDWNLVTGKVTVITAKEVSYVGNVFVAAQESAAFYLNACKAQPSLPLCSTSTYKALIKDLYAARIARNRFEAWFDRHPDDQGGLGSLLAKFNSAAGAAKADIKLLGG